MRPNIDVNIEELVLHGFAPVDRYRVGEAVESELMRLLTESGFASSLRSGSEIASVRADAIQMTQASHPNELGQRIARAVYGAIGQASPSTAHMPLGTAMVPERAEAGEVK